MQDDSDTTDFLSSDDSVIIDDLYDEYGGDTNGMDFLDFGNDYEEFEDVFNDDVDHLDMEKTDGAYYIGLCKYIPREHTLLYLNSVSARTFHKYPFQRILGYLELHSLIYIRIPKLHILKLHVLEDQTYTVVIKTHWIRLVQRHWRKICRERSEILIKRRRIESLWLTSISHKHIVEAHSMPDLVGMMSEYKKITCQKTSNTKTD
jgi:hypothetical protein